MEVDAKDVSDMVPSSPVEKERSTSTIPEAFLNTNEADSNLESPARLKMSEPTSSGTVGVVGDDSWEIKYAKLREVALKLKKSVVEKSQEIERLQNENTKIGSKSQNLSTIQQQYDRALDDVEKYKKLQGSLQKDLQASIKENIGLKQANFDYQAQVKNFQESTKELTEKLTSNQIRDDDVKVLKGRVEELETELKSLQEEQVGMKQEKRQRAMMSLEITDYEKKLSDANEKILGLQRELEVRQNLVEENDKLMATSEMKLREAEGIIGDLNFKIEQFQIEVGQKSEKITFLQTELTKLNEKLGEKKIELANLSREYESAKLNFSTESSVLVERCEKLVQSVSQHEYKNSVLEEHKRSRESHISNLKLELVQLETEFSNYKLKAQSMLQTQKPTGSKSSIEYDELENLQKIVQDFHSEISILKSDMQTLKLENDTLSMERADLGLKLTQMKTAAVEKGVAHDNELQKLKEFIKHKDGEFSTALEQAKTENAALATSYKVRMDSIKSEYESRIKALDNEILALKLFNDSLQDQSSDKIPPVQEVNEEVKRELTASVPTNFPLSIDISSSSGFGIDQVRMMPRGECEGSENNMSPLALLQSPTVTSDLTFEQLLSTDMENLSKEYTTGLHSYSNSTSKAKQVQTLKEELVRCRSQIKHFQNILRESESNCERLTQLNEALKQEVRRVERDSERKEHLKENTEYLKNVILKFVTLHGEDEKRRLIPVITTMLRLSSAETVQIEAAVTGHSNLAHAQPVQDGGSSSGGWTSYVPLPKWSFGGS